MLKMLSGVRLNPFEVREVLQEEKAVEGATTLGLNPFEVREVLQARSGS